MSRSILALILAVAAANCLAYRTDEIVIKEVLAIDRVGRYGRAPIFQDPLESMRVHGSRRTPQAGDEITGVDDQTHQWRELRAGEGDWFADKALEGGYALATIESDTERVMILDASGHSVVFVNGEPRVGDPYETGIVALPVLLRKGSNELLFQCTRGRLRARLSPPKRNAYPVAYDATTPDFIRGRVETLPRGILFLNATTQPVNVPDLIPPLSIRKITLSATYDGVADEVVHRASGVVARVREPGQTLKRTFISAIDGSVQYYAVNPASPGNPEPGRALILSLHGAAVEATNQADAYAAKSWCDIVCPTNRRPFGFDWEDWGRLDAIEVLEHATELYQPDPSRIYLTGHSMGGHGTWIIGALFPDRFAAIGPSAGWISFATYAATRPATQPSSPIRDLLTRAASASDTSQFFSNLQQPGIYILHGADDDNVPADQARQMVEHLGKFHHDFVYHEQPGAGHWWENSDEPGAECVDWPAMFDFFARHRRPRPEEVRRVQFTTPAPSVSSRCHWITIDAQQQAMRPSSIDIRVEPLKRRFIGTTANVARVAVDPVQINPGDPIRVELDGQTLNIPFPAQQRMWLTREDDGWKVIPEPSTAVKNARRGGPFKEAFRNRFMLVYGTRGTAEENAWALAKARFDAETWWYRGNGSVDVIPDVDFDTDRTRDRNVILYGNADTISCWEELLRDSPVQLRRGKAQVGSRLLEGDDSAALFVRPRPGTDSASVAVIGGTGLRGMRTTDRLPVFLSGVGYPDWIVLGADVFQRGRDAIRGAGFFGNDWNIESGDSAWNE